ncbi:PaaI family thioesterase [Ruminiclostridium cellobioparum]|uniref:Thioesterase domain-containing protein n=1 Tax=Ruminiclostridium cellobioparum subsp. termitidis CT1112 TaxID=1195236 RepID=S0FPV4_RUMCE|nr:PaaI family thioesterase [Ruminiclostridium cellobioparum]EMS73882.1 hypothetical protein CTER_0119 [Ruminiclostridium cellobioparum subsp. termitidis CT1112]
MNNSINTNLLWLENFLKETYNAPILENFLGLKIAELSEGKIILTAEIIDKHCNLYGFVHGGTLASVSDIAMGVACITHGKRVVTIDMNVSYIRNTPEGSTITAIGQVISSGRTIMRATGEIYNDERQLLVRSQASYFVTGDFNPQDFPKRE